MDYVGFEFAFVRGVRTFTELLAGRTTGNITGIDVDQETDLDPALFDLVGSTDVTLQLPGKKDDDHRDDGKPHHVARRRRRDDDEEDGHRGFSEHLSPGAEDGAFSAGRAVPGGDDLLIA
jgi:hypothetical protein